MSNFFIKIMFLVGFVLLASCSKSGDGQNNPGSPNSQESSTCQPEYSAASTNLQLATAFNEYRTRCNPSEDQLASEINKIR